MRILPQLLIILLLAATAFGQSGDAISRVQAAYTAGNFAEAIALARPLSASQPASADLHYTLACLFALSDQPDSAFARLDQAIRSGMTDYLFFGTDSDLDKLRPLPRYAALLASARQAALAENRAKALDITPGRFTTVKLNSDSTLPRVSVSLSCDYTALLIMATVEDAHFRDGDRSWRYGDGFMLNFAAPESADSVYTAHFHAFGFSLEKGKPTAVLVNHDGTYLLDADETMLPSITGDSARHRADYSIVIPWSKLAPFHPLLDSLAGINIQYTSQAADGSQKSLRYLPTVMFDTEQTPLRRVAPLRVHRAPSAQFVLSGRVASRLIAERRATATLVVESPRKVTLPVRITLLDSADRVVATVPVTTLDLAPGRNIFEQRVPRAPSPGHYTYRVLLDSTYLWQESLFKPDSAALSELETALEAQHAPQGADSRDALRYRLAAYRAHAAAFSPRSDLPALETEARELADLAARFKENGSVYTRGGYLLSAFRSAADSSLQPFSLVLPEGFDPAKSYPLLVALHGSGVDEVSFAQSAAASPNWKNYIVLAPRGRNLSGWYLGPDERDVVELIALAKRTFHVDRTLCYGFSMGGYGVWRFTLLYPEMFDGAICISGGAAAWTANRAATDVRSHIGQGKKLRYLVMHGTADRALPIADTDSLVATLRERGYDVTYRRIEGGGHGDFPTRDAVQEWLQANFAVKP